MSDCDCGAHYLQKCAWWCGLSKKEIEEEDKRRNHSFYLNQEVRYLREEISKLTETLAKLKEQSSSRQER